ncbi:unnamed protein product [Angiostrongylus costaricensis]|uniref:PCI domain-containing protein 2 homolog n=1 Tax=Angiostrongylus costaricensis TaxID=334426 RepID=A0A0R3PCY6_ANGCS|nr:unnamed protein product [Angiostrongylus costaricensis]
MRFGSVSEYFSTLDRLIDIATWTSATEAAKSLSINDDHTTLPFLHIDGYGARKNRSFIEDEAFDQIVCLHLQVIYHIHVSRNYEAAYTTHTQIMQAFNKEVLQKKKEVNWFMPIFHQLCSDLRNIAKMADELTEKDDEIENISSYYEQSANYIMEAYRTCTSDVRADPSTTKKIAVLNMTNQLFRIYFKLRINKLNLLKPLIRAIDNSGALYQSFSMADKVTYNYFLGRKAMFDADLPLAEKSLSYAFRNCPSECLSNKRLVLIYLIPVKMFLGHMPTAQLLHKYQLDEFHDVVDAVKEGNLAKLDQALEANEHFFIQCGIFLMLEKLRAITFRTLFKATIIGGHLIPLKAFYIIIQYLGITDVDEDELECIVANLIAEKKIKGYISHQHQKLVISKKDPFPPLSSV